VEEQPEIALLVFWGLFRRAHECTLRPSSGRVTVAWAKQARPRKQVGQVEIFEGDNAATRGATSGPKMMP